MAASTSQGVFYAVSALYLTRVVGLTAAVVGVGLTVAGACGVVASYAAGRASDRWGADRVQRLGLVGQAAALVGYVLVDEVVGFVVAAAAAVAFRSAQGTARQAILARWFDGPDRVAVRARLRVVTNVSIGLGTVLAGAALLVDTATAYRSALAVVALLLVLALVPLLRLRRTVPDLPLRTRRERLADAGGAAPRGRSPWRDPTYLTSTALGAVLAVQFGLQTVGVPLWVSQRTQAPTVVVSGLLVVNTVVVALLQVAASRGTHEVRRAGVVARRGALLLATACLVYAAAAHVGPAAAVVVLVVAAALGAVAEVLTEAGSWGLAFELADPTEAGAYQGVSQTGYAAATMLAPLVVTATALEHGLAGWVVLAVLFAAAGLGLAALAHRVGRTGDRALPGPATAE